MAQIKGSVLAVAAVTAISITAFASAGVSAMTMHKEDSLVAAIATKFNLSQAEVQRVFDEQHQKMDMDHAERISERLQKLVDEGVITVEQKALIEVKLAELRAQRAADKASWKTLSAEERKAQKEERKAALEAWAQQHNLELGKLKGIFMSETRVHHEHRAEVSQQ